MIIAILYSFLNKLSFISMTLEVLMGEVLWYLCCVLMLNILFFSSKKCKPWWSEVDHATSAAQEPPYNTLYLQVAGKTK